MRRRLVGSCIAAVLAALVPAGAAAGAPLAPQLAPTPLAAGVLLSKGRVKVIVTYKNPYTGKTGFALALPQGDEFAYFTFSSDANPEVFVKVLGENDPNNLQLFAAGLTTFEYTVTFLGCGQTKTFVKPAYARITYEEGAAFPTRGCQALSDPLDATHTATVRTEPATGKLLYAAVTRDRDGRRIGAAFPSGRRAAGRPGVNERRLSITDFKVLLATKPTPLPGAGILAPALGWNASVGPTPGQCFNYTTMAPGSGQTQSVFSSLNTASSFSAQTKMSSSISVGFAGFSSDDSYSFSESSKSSTNTGSFYFNGYSLYTLNNAIDPTNTLTPQGTDAFNNQDNFAALCGTSYLTSVPAGMLATGRLSFNSQSASATSAISTSLSAGYDLTKLSTAMSNAKSTSTASVSLDFELEVEGGGTAAGQILSDMASPIDKYLPSCAAMTTAGLTDCDNFAAAANQAISKGIASFQTTVTQAKNDYTSMATFPNGVAGVSIPSMQAAPLPALSIPDFLAPYKTQLNQTMTLLNQFAALDNRVNLYLIPAVAQVESTVLSILDLNNYLNALHYNYSNARNALFADLDSCLNASKSKSAATDCAGVLQDSKSASAYAFIAGSYLAQQNTIALQWAGTADPSGHWGGPIPVDYVFVDYLPPYSGSPEIKIANQPALVAMIDQPWNNTPGQYYQSCGTGAVCLNWFVLPRNEQGSRPISEITTDITQGWAIDGYEYSDNYAPGPLAWTSVPCTPAFAAPCVLDAKITAVVVTPYYLQWNVFLSMDPISTFFTP